MFLDFLYTLRAHKVPVGLQEWMALLEALALGLHQSSFTGFYYLARSLLVHSEAQFDAFDQAFSAHFAGIETDALKITEELQQWLADPSRLAYLSSEQRAALEAFNLDELRRKLEERLREQKERHDGGSHWIGTGGTSPFGHGGYHPTGVRIGGVGGGRSAAQIASERRFKDYRNDLVLDVRQIKVALRKLRDLRRDGTQNELDLEETIDKTCRNAGELDLVWRAPRRNNLKLLLMMDVGGSMTPHSRVVSQLFSAANQSKHFRDFQAFYFHNCVYEKVYRDAWFRQGVSIAELLKQYGKNYKLVLVGDAMMHPLELFEIGGIINYWEHNRTPGITWLRRLAAHFERTVWLTPEPEAYWDHMTVRAIRGIFPMFELTLAGLDQAIAALVKGRRARKVFADDAEDDLE